MKKFSLSRFIGFVGLFVILIFFLALIFFNQIKSEMLELISVYGYPAIFFITFLTETLVQPIGPEVSLITGRILSLDAVSVAVVVIISSTVASLVNYRIGHLFYPKISKDKTFKKYSAFYKKYGKYGLLISSLGPVPYVPFCWFSGAFELKIKRFFYFGIFPRILRIMFVSYIVFLLF